MNMLMIGDIKSVCDGSDPLFGFTQVTSKTLESQNVVHRGSGGISQENCHQGFCPAVLDSETGSIYVSRYADGKPAPMHILDGLPQDIVTQRTEDGKVKAIKPTITVGFVRHGEFYTRQQAARVIADCVAQQDSSQSLEYVDTAKAVNQTGSI